ncbi:MAG: hemerythrin domain-containing protein [Deltaproteobacteria bacterium]|nr:hemerythrin domain-containing protein [Deltaproteobacteria bacterium]MDZ4341081.1 hemerythrin domain-containing protein [Candidatus Binatia bacterium]
MSNDLSFLQLTKVHQWLDELFLAHRTALLGLDLSQAKLLFDRYETNLLLHMKDEEESLIPIYGARISDVPGGAVELFIAEHKKIRKFLAEFYQALRELRNNKGLALKHKAIELLDREGMYAGLLQHHHAREQNALYPWLELITSVEERANLLAGCSSLSAYKASLDAGQGAK